MRLRWAALAWAVFCLLSPAFAQLRPVPAGLQQLQDLAGVLSQAARERLLDRLQAIERQRGSQLAILLVASTRPEPIEDFSIRVVDQWKLGRKDVDDGVLLLVAVEDRRMRIEVGRGLEGAIPDAIAKRIIEERMAPAFRRGDFEAGLSAAIDAIDARLAGEALPPPPRAGGRHGGTDFETLLSLGLFASIFGGSILRSVFGRLLGSALAAGLIGVGAWIMTGALLVALVAAGLAFVFVLAIGGSGSHVIGSGRHGGGRRSGGWSGGGWSGGGGGFGGGGASGGW